MPSEAGNKRSDVEIAIICALPVEARAVKALLEETSDDDIDDGDVPIVTKAEVDENVYTLGKISGHTVVLIHMPSVGKISAAAVTTHLKHNYTAVRLTLLVGNCDGVPNEKDEVRRRLGDVVVGTDIIQFDLGRQYPGEFEQSDHSQALIGRPSTEIQAFIKKLESLKEYLEEETRKTIAKSIGPDFRLTDDLYDPDYWHMHHVPEDCPGHPKRCAKDQGVCDDARSLTCDDLKCDMNNLERRDKRTELKPLMHFGSIASGDLLMQSGTHRDDLAQRKNVIAFDTEGAGVAMHQSSLVVRSISSYADSHKNTKWQEHASLSAAACVKAIIRQWPRIDKPESKPKVS